MILRRIASLLWVILLVTACGNDTKETRQAESVQKPAAAPAKKKTIVFFWWK
jgi:hypothetical protein